jgi:UDP-N-acetylmuramoyl-tripeptide--D-alanyl-D-alanine ligase
MAELGDAAPAEHAAMADLAAALGIRLIAFDEPAYGAELADDLDEVVALLGELDEDDAVLVKGSRVAGLERLTEMLIGA